MLLKTWYQDGRVVWNRVGLRNTLAAETEEEPMRPTDRLAIIALATGAPVVPATSWREDDGRHVLRFEAPIPAVEDANTNEAIRLTTRAYNAALERLVLRRPEQWYWVHRRWKSMQAPARRRKLHAASA